MSPSLLDDLLSPDGLTTLFQPIFSTFGGRNRLFGYEALTRGPRGTNLERADVLFEYVRRKGREVVVDRACVRSALREYATLRGPVVLSLNVHAATIESDAAFASFLAEACAEAAVEPKNLMLEIVEQQPFCDEERFLKHVGALRSLGARIALDDVGMGYSSARTMVQVRPDFFKVDRWFVHGSREDEALRIAMRSIVRLAQDLGGQVIAEGIERGADLDVAFHAGVDLYQGFLLAGPMSAESIRASGETWRV